ncbi:MAG TPA: hypothetical protein VI913_05045 [Candidatus Peribacteraceae bacterium]|nr:hypothetical protein [Candidatus Peribacteraceae bacterium]
MEKSFRVVLKLVLIAVVIALAVIGAMLVLDLVSGPEARETLTKSLMIIGIVGVACLGVLLLARPKP